MLKKLKTGKGLILWFPVSCSPKRRLRLRPYGNQDHEVKDFLEEKKKANENITLMMETMKQCNGEEGSNQPIPCDLRSNHIMNWREQGWKRTKWTKETEGE